MYAGSFAWEHCTRVDNSPFCLQISGSQIIPLCRDAVPHASPRTVDVTLKTRYDVIVKPHHSLTGGCSTIHPDVVPIGLELYVQFHFDSLDQLEQFSLFGIHQTKERDCIVVRHDQAMSGETG